MIEALNPAAAHWRDTTANVRVHSTTRQRPVDLFAQAERPALQPLPAGPHPCAVSWTAACSSRFRVTVDSNCYSVPSQHASRKLTVAATAQRVMVYDLQHRQLLADHPRSHGRGEDILNPEHERDLVLRTRYAREQQQLTRFLSLGTAATRYLDGLREKRPNWRSHVQRINALVESFGRDEVARLLADACEQNAYSSEYVLNILEARKRRLPEPAALHITRNQDLLEKGLPAPDLSVYR